MPTAAMEFGSVVYWSPWLTRGSLAEDRWQRNSATRIPGKESALEPHKTPKTPTGTQYQYRNMKVLDLAESMLQVAGTRTNEFWGLLSSSYLISRFSRTVVMFCIKLSLTCWCRMGDNHNPRVGSSLT
jgi:hypothetical protein